MLRVLIWEFGKLVRLRSMQAGMVTALLLPILWAFAPGLRQSYNLEFASGGGGWQLPALSLFTGMEYLFPFLVAIASAEVLGSEVTTGTLKSLLLRPSPRSRLLGAKLLVILAYPMLLVLFSMLGSLVVGLRYGLGSFFGGTGFGSSVFVGEGLLTPGAAFLEIFRSHILAGITLWPIATLALLFSVIFLSTTTAALAAVSSVFFMRLFIVFPTIQFFLLTTYLNLYNYSGRATVAQLLGRPIESVLPIGITLLLIYTVGFAALALLIFERKDI